MISPSTTGGQAAHEARFYNGNRVRILNQEEFVRDTGTVQWHGEDGLVRVLLDGDDIPCTYEPERLRRHTEPR